MILSKYYSILSYLGISFVTNFTLKYKMTLCLRGATIVPILNTHGGR